MFNAQISNSNSCIDKLYLQLAFSFRGPNDYDTNNHTMASYLTIQIWPCINLTVLYIWLVLCPFKSIGLDGVRGKQR